MDKLPRLGACIVFSAVAATAGGILEPFLQRGWGSTLYRLGISVPAEATGGNGPERLESELEYPLDAFQVGFRARHEWGGEDGRRKGLHASAWTNFTDPSGEMEDSDWFGPSKSSLYKFSYTRSRAELRGFGGEAGMDIAGPSLLGKPTRYGLALRAEHFSFEMFGVEGWQRFPGEPSTPVEGFPGERVLTYDILRVMPRLYADIALARGPRVSWNASVSAAPAFAKDYDDHVLRLKESDTYAHGFEVGLRTEVAVRLSEVLSLAAAADCAWFRAKGEMDQRFYGDDPFSPEDETGASIKGVDTRIEGLGGGFSLGMRFRY